MNTTRATKRILSFALALCLLLGMAVYLPGPVEVSAQLPQGGYGTVSDGINFDDLIGSGIYYGTYDHATNLSGATEGGQHKPVLWRAMGEEDDNTYLTLMSEYVLDSSTFDNSYTHNKYADSDIIPKLSAMYGDLFTNTTEKGYVMQTDVETVTHTYGTETPVNTYDSTAYGQYLYIPWGTAVNNSGWENNVFWTADSQIEDRYAIDRSVPDASAGSNATTFRSGGTSVRYWLRSPYSINSYHALFVYADGDVDYVDVHRPLGVRPAFQLNPSSIIFTSEIGLDESKGGTRELNGYALPIAASAADANYKLTIVNNSINIGAVMAESETVNATTHPIIEAIPGGSISVTANGADSGTQLTYKIVSSTPNRTIVGYGQDAGNAGLTVEANDLDGTSLDPGSYTVYVWLQKDGGIHSHEGSTPVYFTLDVINDDATLASVAGESISDGGEQGTVTDPKTAAISLGQSSWSSVADSDLEPTDTNATAELYDDDTYTNQQSSIALNDPDITPTTDLYIKVTAEDGVSELYYKVTVTLVRDPVVPTDPGVLTLGDMTDDTVEEGEDYHKTIPATYVGNTTVSLGYSVSGLPGGLTANGREISGQPDVGTAAGSPYTIDVAVTAGTLQKSGSYTLTVTDTPVDTYLELASIGNDRIKLGDSYTKALSVAYNGTSTLTYTITGLPNGVTYDLSTGVITGPATESGTFPIDVRVEESGNPSLFDTGDFILTVDAASTPPPQGSYTITASAGTGGSISPSGGVTVAEGADQTFTIATDTDYHIADVRVDGNSAGAVDSYTFTDVQANHTIAATFAQDGDSGSPGGSTSSGSRSSSGGSGSTYIAPPKTQLPASAFSWDGDRTLTIDHERITPLGLLRVDWDGITLNRGTDFSVYQGSVIVRFGEDFMAAQATGNHTVRVEFLNHHGETTVTVGMGTEAADVADNNTYNPNTGGYPDGGMGAADNPNTGDSSRRGIWPALLLGSLSGLVLVKLRPVLRVKG